MKMQLKKECKWTTVYEVAEEDSKDAPVRSVYVSKEWLIAHSGVSHPQEIELEVKVPA